MYVRSSWLALVVGALVMLAAGLASAKEPQYVGAKKCKSCHKKELMGNQYGEWEKGVHHKAFETLKSDDAVKIAAEKQCESCHGPGSLYRKKKVMSDRDKSVAAGMWEPEKDAKICTACHNDESPTWDPAKGFDHEARMEEIALSGAGEEAEGREGRGG
jgi:hypothetical protein